MSVPALLAQNGIQAADGDRIPCPIHGGEDANFLVSADGFRCWSRCGGGDVVQLYAALRGAGPQAAGSVYGRALHELALELGLEEEAQRTSPGDELPQLPPRVSPRVVSDLERRAEIASLYSRHVAGEAEGAALVRFPAGTGKTHTGLAVLLEQQAAPAAEGVAALLVPTHTLIEEVMGDMLPKVVAALGGTVEDVRTVEAEDGITTLDFVARLPGGARLPIVRRPPLACDPRLSKAERLAFVKLRSEASELEDGARSACRTCRLSEGNAEVSRTAACASYAEQKDYAKRRKAAAIDVTTHASGLGKAARASIVVADESILGRLSETQKAKWPDVTAYLERLGRVRRKFDPDAEKDADGEKLELLAFAEEATRALKRIFEREGGAAKNARHSSGALPRPESVDGIEEALAHVGWFNAEAKKRSKSDGRNLTRGVVGILRAWSEGRDARVLLDWRGGGLKLLIPCLHHVNHVDVLLDATGDADVLRACGFEVAQELRAWTPEDRDERAKVRVVQFTDARASKTALSPRRAKAEGKDAARNVARLAVAAAGRLTARALELLGHQEGEPIGLVTHLAVEDERRAGIAKEASSPVVAGHHHAILGLNGLNAPWGVVDGPAAFADEDIRALALRIDPDADEDELAQNRRPVSATRAGETLQWFGFEPGGAMDRAHRALASAAEGQAIARFTRRGSCAKGIVVFGPTPLETELEVQRVTARELLIDEGSVARRVVALEVRRRFPDLSLRALAALLDLPDNGEGRARAKALATIDPGPRRDAQLIAGLNADVTDSASGKTGHMNLGDRSTTGGPAQGGWDVPPSTYRRNVPRLPLGWWDSLAVLALLKTSDSELEERLGFTRSRHLASWRSGESEPRFGRLATLRQAAAEKLRAWAPPTAEASDPLGDLIARLGVGGAASALGVHRRTLHRYRLGERDTPAAVVSRAAALLEPAPAPAPVGEIVDFAKLQADDFEREIRRAIADGRRYTRSVLRAARLFEPYRIEPPPQEAAS